jgi:hypothetical protein
MQCSEREVHISKNCGKIKALLEIDGGLSLKT